jgi:threonine/homoserine/homoserine lactone efflux protein
MRQQVLAFAAITIPLVLTPGITTTLVLRSSLVGGASHGYVTAIGAAAASCCYGIASAFGTSMLLRVWPRALIVLEFSGAAYIAWLGARAAVRSARYRDDTSDRAVRSGFREGFLANALNPPVALFYFLIVPRFVPSGSSVIVGTFVLTLVHVTLAFAWHATCAAAAGALAHVLASTSARRAIDLVTGLVLIAFAVRMLVR